MPPSDFAKFRPTALLINVPIPNEPLSDKNNKSKKYFDSFFLADIMHERSHWLQYIGTTSGLASYIITHLQNAITFQDFFKNPSLSPDSLPLLQTLNPESPWKGEWETLELFYRCIFGGVSYHSAMIGCQYEVLSRIVAWFGDFCGERMREHGTYSRREAKRNIQKWKRDLDLKAQFDLLLMPMGDDEIVGAIHMFESAATLNELPTLERALAHNEPKYMLDRDMYFRGERNQLAYRKFYGDLGVTPNYKTDIVLACILDWAVNPPIPPVTPPSYLTLHWRELMPGLRFVSLVELVKGFDFSQMESLTPESIKDTIGSLYIFVKEKTVGLTIKDRVLRLFTKPDILCMTPTQTMGFLKRTFGKLANLAIPEGLYRITNDGKLSPSEMWLMKFLLSMGLRSLNIREENPEFFVFPGLLYVIDGPRFNHLYDQVRCPLQMGPNNKLCHTGDYYHWGTFFLINAIVQDFARWIALCSFEELLENLRFYVNVAPVTDVDPKEYVLDILGNHIGGCPLFEEISVLL